MALISCPECGKEMSDKALSCPACGYQLEMNTKTIEQVKVLPNNKSNKKIVVVVVALILLIALIFGATAGRKIFLYNSAISCVEKGEIAEAKEKFAKIEDYKDSAQYIEKMTSKIDGVSDHAYYFGMQFVEKVSSSDYREELATQLATMTKDEWGEEWTSIPIKDIASVFKSSDIYLDIQKEISNVVSDGSKDEEFAELLDMYYYIIIDNAYAVGLLEGGKECSDKFAVMCSLIQLSGEIDIDAATLDKLTYLDDVIELTATKFEESSTLSDLNYVEFVAMMTIFYISGDSE